MEIMPVPPDLIAPAEPPSPTEIRAWLDRHGMTQTDLAVFAGVDARTARRWVADAATDRHQDPPRMLWHAMRRLDEISRQLDLEAPQPKSDQAPTP